MCRFTLFLMMAVMPLVGSQPVVPKPDISIPRSFENQPAGSSLSRELEWWKGFDDPLMDELLQKAAKTNLDVRKAGARLAEARALRTGAKAALLPSIDSSTSASRLRGGLNQGVVRVTSGGTQKSNFLTGFDSGLLSTGFNMRWELDVFGGIRKSVNVSQSEERSASENVRNAQVLVRAEVARNYIEMRAAEDQIELVRSNEAAEKELLDLIRIRADAGLASQLDVDRQVVLVASASALLPDLDALRLRSAYRIAVLLGEYPGALVERFSSASHAMLKVPPVPLAVPSDLLRNRPDIRRADAEIAAAYARVRVAHADLFPKFVITGLSGRQAADFSGLTVGAGNFFSVGPGVSLPIFNFGKIRSNIAARDAQLEEAVRTYEQEVLAAFEETENALIARDRAEQRQRELQAGLEAARRSVTLAQDLFTSGLGDFLAVLDAQRVQFRIERDLADARASVLLGTVMVYKALGD